MILSFFIIQVVCAQYTNLFNVTDIPNTAVPPMARLNPTMAYSKSQNLLMIFGGSDDSYYNDLWSFGLDKANWKIIYPNSPGPGIR